MTVTFRASVRPLTVCALVSLLSGCYSYSGDVGARMGDTLGFAFVELAKALPGEDIVEVLRKKGDTETTAVQENKGAKKKHFLKVNVNAELRQAVFSMFPEGYRLVEIPENRVSLAISADGSRPSLSATIDLAAAQEAYDVDIVYVLVLDPELAIVSHQRAGIGGVSVREKYALGCTVFGWNVEDSSLSFRDKPLAHTVGFHAFSGAKEVSAHFSQLAKTLAECIVRRFTSRY